MAEPLEAPRMTEAQRRILSELGELRGTSAEAVLAEDRSLVRFTAALKRRAEKAGLSVQDVLHRDLQAMRASRYPGPDCLETREVEAWVRDKSLSDVRLAHVESCPGCTSLLGLARAEPARMEAVLAGVRQELVLVSAGGAARKSRWMRLVRDFPRGLAAAAALLVSFFIGWSVRAPSIGFDGPTPQSEASVIELVRSDSVTQPLSKDELIRLLTGSRVTEIQVIRQGGDPLLLRNASLIHR